MIRKVNKPAYIFSLVALLVVFTVSSTNFASALSGSEWNTGRIIDDGVFFNSSSMNPSQIQDFLNVKVPSCDTNGQQTLYDSAYGDTVTRAVYSSRRGVSTPFTCLKDFHATTSDIAPESGICAGYTGAANESAATIIYRVAQSCGISPKVILVTLQKEQSLVTDDWPWPIQYEKAMGAFCPDTSPCDSGYAGFFKQVYYGANRFKVYAANPTYFNYQANRNNTIYYNPGPCQTYSGGVCTKYYGNKYDANGNSIPDITYCGSSTVYIENQATANLYIYTPYQPNAAALSNLYGTGDYCSAYGNRNFWRMFRDWFGTTYANGYEAQVHSQSPYPTIYNGTSQTVNIAYTNLGFARWYDDTSVPQGGNPVHLAATSPINRSSIFSSTWPSSGRAAQNFARVYESDGVTLASNQHAVEPGQIAVFEFQLTASDALASGVYRETFQPVLEGATNWAMGGISWLDVTVTSPYAATFNKQSAYPKINANDSSAAYIEYKNTGIAYWYDDLTAPTNNTVPVRLAATSPINRSSIFSSTWPSSGRAAQNFNIVYLADGVTPSPYQHVVRPGEIVHFDFNLTAKAGTLPNMYREYFQPVKEGPGNWNMGGLSWLDVTVNQSNNKATFNSQSAYPTINRGQAAASFLAYKNDGNTNWYDDSSATAGISPVHLAATNPINRLSVFSYGWPSGGRPNQTFSKVYESDGTTLAANQHITKPGQIAHFDFNLTAPWNINYGTAREYFQPILEGTGNWSMGGLSWLDITVN